MVQRAVGRILDDQAGEHLLAGIGIERFEWPHHRDGLAYVAYGLMAVMIANRAGACRLVLPACVHQAIVV